MTKLYRFLDDKNTVVRLISNKSKAEELHLTDRRLRIETVKLFKVKKRDDVYITEYKILGDGIV
jgi:hypothetical protein